MLLVKSTKEEEELKRRRTEKKNKKKKKNWDEEEELKRRRRRRTEKKKKKKNLVQRFEPVGASQISIIIIIIYFYKQRYSYIQCSISFFSGSAVGHVFQETGLTFPSDFRTRVSDVSSYSYSYREHKQHTRTRNCIPLIQYTYTELYSTNTIHVHGTVFH